MTTYARRRPPIRYVLRVRGGVSGSGSVVTRLASGAAGLALRRVTGNELSAGELSHGRRLPAADTAAARARSAAGPEGGAPPPAQPSHW